MMRTKRLVVSVHDVAPPHWERVQRMLQALDSVGVSRRSLLVIPNLQGRWPLDEHDDFCAELRQRREQGDELVLHGFEHVGVGEPRGALDRFRNRWFTQGEGEFLSLSYREASERLGRGSELARRMGLDVAGFIAPAWLINAEGLRAARDCGFLYTNSYFTFTDLVAGQSWLSPSLVFGPGHLNDDAALVLQRQLVTVLRRSAVVRVVLHPPCVDDARRFAEI